MGSSACVRMLAHRVRAFRGGRSAALAPLARLSRSLATAFTEQPMPFGAVQIEAAQVPCADTFATHIEAALPVWRQDKVSAVWLRAAAAEGAHMAAAAHLGFRFHHAEGEDAVMNPVSYTHLTLPTKA